MCKIYLVLLNQSINKYYNGGVAQLARAFGSYPKGRGFDSLRRYQKNNGPLAQLVRADGS